MPVDIEPIPESPWISINEAIGWSVPRKEYSVIILFSIGMISHLALLLYLRSSTKEWDSIYRSAIYFFVLFTIGSVGTFLGYIKYNTNIYRYIPIDKYKIQSYINYLLVKLGLSYSISKPVFMNFVIKGDYWIVKIPEKSTSIHIAQFRDFSDDTDTLVTVGPNRKRNRAFVLKMIWNISEFSAEK